MSKAEKLRLVLFGEGGVGKSAITIRYFQVRLFLQKKIKKQNFCA